MRKLRSWISQLIWGDTRRYSTSLSPEQLHLQLTGALTGEWGGNASPTGFRMSHRIAYTNSFNPRFVGTFEPIAQGGTRVVVRAGLHPLVRLFVMAWLLFFGMGALSGLFSPLWSPVFANLPLEDAVGVYFAGLAVQPIRCAPSLVLPPHMAQLRRREHPCGAHLQRANSAPQGTPSLHLDHLGRQSFGPGRIGWVQSGACLLFFGFMLGMAQLGLRSELPGGWQWVEQQIQPGE